MCRASLCPQLTEISPGSFWKEEGKCNIRHLNFLLMSISMHYRIALPITCLAIILGLINLSKMFFFNCKTKEFFVFAFSPNVFATRRTHHETALQRGLFLCLSFSEAIKLAIKKSFSHNSMVGVRHLPFRVSDGVNKIQCGK